VQLRELRDIVGRDFVVAQLDSLSSFKQPTNPCSGFLTRCLIVSLLQLQVVLLAALDVSSVLPKLPRAVACYSRRRGPFCC